MAPKRRERWYSLEGQRRIHDSALQSNTGPRRLISLIVLLILVLLMIRQVSDTKKVATVAGAIGLLPPQAANSSQQVDSPQTNQPDGSSKEQPLSDSPPGQWDLEIENLGLVSPDPSIERQSQILERLMRNLPLDVKSVLVEKAFGIADQPKKNVESGSDSINALQDWLSTSQTTLARWIDLLDSQSAEHAAMMDLQSVFMNWYSSDSKLVFEQIPVDLQRSFRLALDRTLLADLSDNTPWRTAERLPLARLLVRAAQLAQPFKDAFYADAVPSIAIPQLLSQTDTLRGRCFRLGGTVGLMEQDTSMELANARKLSYSVLWLKPDDLSEQPINVYVPQEVTIARDLKVGDSVQVVGLIAKRRAYASQRGGEIAPVLIAASVEIEDQETGSSIASHRDSERASRTHSIARSLSSSGNGQAWIPPVDRQAPLDLVQQALSKHLAKIQLAKPEMSQVQTLASDPVLLACLANLVKFRSEVDTVVSGGNSTLLSTRNSTESSTLDHQPLLSSWQGYVTGIQRLQVDPKTLPGLDWREAYLLELASEPIAEIGTPPARLAVLAKEVPVRWHSATKIYQPVLIQGLGLFSLEENSPDTASLRHRQPRLLIASHVAWQYPTAPAPTIQTIDEWEPKLSRGHLRLLQSGWDLAQADALERMHGQSITSKEAKAFYTLLARATFARSDFSQETTTSTSDPASLKTMDWIRRTEAMKLAKSDDGSLERSVGERIEARVQIRRIQRVDVRNPEHQTWLGANHYYQLDGVADIGPSRIEVRYGKDYEPIAYERDFPITLVATKLPTWILSDPSTLGETREPNQEASDLDSSASIAWSTKIRVDVHGYAYRIWRFRTPQVSAATQDTGYQQAPMMVVDNWQLARGAIGNDRPTQKNQTSLPSIITTILGLAAIGWFAYRMTSNPKKIDRRKEASRRSDR